MDSFDELVMLVDKIQTQINELLRSSEDMNARVMKLATLFTEYYAVSDKRYLLLERRVSRLEGKI